VYKNFVFSPISILLLHVFVLALMQWVCWTGRVVVFFNL